MLLAFIGIQAATPNKLYVFGDAPFGGWAYNPISGGTAVEMTKSGDKFTWSGSITSTCYFAFLTQDGTDWGNLNSNYRLSSTTQAVALDKEYALSSGDRSMKLTAGDYTFTVDYSSGSPKLTVSGYAPEVVITSYTVLGAEALFGTGWDLTGNEMTKVDDNTYTYSIASVALAAGDYDYKVTANHQWGIAEYPESGNQQLTITEAATYKVDFTLDLSKKELTAVATKVSEEQPEVTGLYLVGDFNEWTAQDEKFQFTKREDGKFEFTVLDYTANAEFKFVDNNGTWYGSATGAREELGQTNYQNVALVIGGMDNNFFSAESGNFDIVVDLANMKFDIQPKESIVEAPEHLYILGNVQGWDPSNGSAEMTRTKIKDGKYKYEFTGTFPDGGEGKTYFSFTSKLGENAEDWTSIADSRYGAKNNNEEITADNTDPYDLKAGENSFVLPAGTYRIELNWKEEGPDLAMWVHTEEAPAITELSMIGSFCGWEGGVAMTKNDEGKFVLEQALSAEDEFKFIDNLGNWYGATAEGDNFWITADVHEGLDLNSSASGKNFYMPSAGTYTFTVDLENLKLDVAGEFGGGEEEPAEPEIYVVGSMTEWQAVEEAKMTKQADGTYYLFIEDIKASEAEPIQVKFKDEANNIWYGSTHAEGEVIGPDNCDNIPVTTEGGETNNFIINQNVKNVKITFDLANLKFSVDADGGEEAVVEAPEHLYILGDIQGWDPSNGSVEMTRTKIKDGKYKYEFTGAFPDGGNGKTYLSFTSKLGADAKDWESIADGRYGAYNEDEEITADNTDPYDLKAGANAFVLPAGYYRIELNWKEEGPDLTMWVHTEEAPAITELSMIGSFCGWEGGVAMTKNEEGKFVLEQALSAEDEFKFIDNLGNWYGATAEGENFWITADVHEGLDLNNSATGKNFYMPAAGTYTFTVDLENLKLDVAGEFGGGEQPAETELYLIGSFCGWEQDAKVKFTKVEEKFVLENQEIEQYGQFKLVDSNGVWYGATAEGETFWITSAAHTGIALNNTDAGKNFYINDAGTYTFTVDLENLTLDVDGDFSELELKKFAALDEEVTYNNETYVMESTADWKGIQCWIGDASTTKGNYLKVTTDPASRLKIMAYYVNDGGSATLEAPEEAQAEYYLKLDPEKALQKVIIQTAVAGTVTFTSCAIVEEGPAQPEATPEHLYLIGDIISYQWSYQPIADGKAIEMTKDGDKFTWSGRIDKYSSFAFITQDGESWEDLNGNYRFGPEIEPSYPQMGEVIVMHRSGYAYSLEAGDYQFEVDFSGDQPTLTVTGTPDEKPAVEVPEHLYVLGTLNEDGWAPNAGLEMTKNENTFTLADVVVTATAGFSFTNKLAETDDAWDDIATSRYGAAEDRTVVEPDQFYQVVYGNNDNAFIVEPGTYTFVVTFNESDITLAVTGEADQPVIEVPEHLYILGDVNEAGWAANVGAEMTKNENVFTWEGTVGDDTYFSFTNLLADSDIDWTAIADHRYGALTDGTIVTVGNEYKVVQGEGAFKVAAGTYTFTVTFGESDIKLAVAGQAETKPDLYLVGSMTEWSESDNYKFTYDADKDEYSLTLNLTEGDVFKFKSGENWYSNTGNPLTLDEYGGTFDITDGANITVGLTEEFTFIVKGNFSSFSYTCAAAPAVKPLYLVGSFNDWTQQDPSYRFTWDEEWEEYQLTVQLTEGQELKFVDGEGNWYGNTDGQLQLTADNAQVDFDMALGGIDNNFVAAATGTYTFYVDIEYLQFYYEFEEEVFELPEVATYVEDHNFAYFEKPADWADEIYAYTWQDAGNAPVGKKKVSAAWPGDLCEYVGLADNGNKVYRYVFDDDADYIIFNDNNANQTGDENFVNAGYYQVDGLKTTVPSTATAITGLNADVESGKVKAYNLQGMEVRSLSRGLYIINGKKVMIRK